MTDVKRTICAWAGIKAVVIGLLFALVASATSQPALSLTGASGAPGATVTVDVSLSPGGGTAPVSVQWDLTYSSSDLSLVTGTYDGTGVAASGAGKSVACNSISAGDVRCIVSGINTTPMGSGVLATLTFKIASGTTDTSTPVALTSSVASDGNANYLSITEGSATVTINQPACALSLSTDSSSLSSGTGSGSFNVVTAAGCSWSVVNNSTFITVTAGSSGTGNGTVSYSVTADSGAGRMGTLTIATQTFTVTQAGQTATAGLEFNRLTPCRVVDTRVGTGFSGAFGPPYLSAGATRSFPVQSSSCGVPGTAQAYSFNITVVPHGALGYLTAWPTGSTLPVTATLNSIYGNIVGNAAIVVAGTGGAISLFASNDTDVIVDINGYFAPPTAQSLAFYPVTPCRVADTRTGAGFTGAFGPPSMVGGATRDFPVQQSTCGIPSTAEVYAVRMTVVAHAPVGYLTAWPAGGSLPVAATLNAPLGGVIGNEAIVPAGTAASGPISVYASANTDLVIDITGYFAPPGSAGALSFYPLTQCRIADTRAGSGFTGSFGQPSLVAGATRYFPLLSGSCSIPNAAQAYSLNMTAVVPSGGALGYLTAFPAGQALPVAATLNALTGGVVAAAAIVPAGTSGAISVYAMANTDLIIDINGYYGP